MLDSLVVPPATVEPRIPELPRLADYVDHWAAHRPQREAAVLGSQRLSWADLAESVSLVGRGLLDAGVRRGDRVALLSAPTPEFLAVYVGCAAIGAVFLGLNPKHTATELAGILADADPAVVVLASDQDGSRLDAALARVGGARRAAMLDAASLRSRGGRGSEQQLVDARAQVTGADACCLVYTSGSTGAPKGALLPHRGLTRCSVVQARRLYRVDGGRMLCNLPISHVGCLGDLCASALVDGGTLVFQPSFDAGGVLRLIEAEGVQHWGAVPAMFGLTMAAPEWLAADLSTVDLALWSGGAMALPAAERLAERVQRLANLYGMTETVGSVTYADPGTDLPTMCATVGRPDPSYEVRIARPDGSSCSAGEAGEIVVRGDFIMLGYHNRPDATAEVIDAEGWLHTGDLAVEDDRGNYLLTGRTRELFKSGGYTVNPREVEDTLAANPAVRLAAVVAAPDPLWGEVGHAFVVAQDEAVDVDALKAFLAERLATYKRPKSLRVVESLPLLPIGKVDKAALRARIGDGEEG